VEHEEGIGLEALGWGPFFADQLTRKDARRGGRPARIVEAFRKSYLVHTGERVLPAAARGAMFHRASGRKQDLPAVGDWVVVDRLDAVGHARVWRMLERRSLVVRKAAGESTAPQVIAANVDVLFVVTALNSDFNLRRLERYLALVADSGARGVVVLNKADLVDDVAPFVAQVRQLDEGGEVPIVTTSMKRGGGVDALSDHIKPRETIALIGSSGVGKSTMINALAGEERQLTGAVREADGRGRHTTTTRQLIAMPDGALMIDTPGMRELHLWGDASAIDDAFAEIDRRSEECKFRDCMHGDEPGCAVRAAVEAGEVSAERLASWRNLQAERAELAAREEELERAKAKRRSAARRWSDS
jgi:ribosome biogenesis GTPase